ncbi:MAG: type II/IV secretion system protein [Opitutales bacterium]|nr:type II/IV secretion system protein [Opitutales bacterium]
MNSTNNPLLKEVRFSYAELMAEVAEERKHSAFAREMLDDLEIRKIFRAKKKKKQKTEDSVPGQTLRATAPAIPPETQVLLDEIVDDGNLSRLEDAVRSDMLSRDMACNAWANHHGVAYVDPLQSVSTPEALEAIPEEVARRINVLGLYIMDGVITVVTPDPVNADNLRRLAAITGLKVSASFALPSEVADALNIRYASKDIVEDSVAEFEAKHGVISRTLSDLQVAELADAAPVIKIVDSLIHLAIRERASDIHIEPQEGYSRVRLRVDGRLRMAVNISNKIHPALVARLKILSRLSIEESRFPQDGKFSIPFGMSKADFRSSFFPSTHGNKVVIRILASTGKKSILSLDDMMISQSILKPYRRIAHNPNGIVFITGPTGSGKTTTLYATLQELNSEDVNISTIEDPVEIPMEGLTQGQVNQHIDLNFPILLRSLLRQDPDIILVGEIRDRETAKIATEAALTGHLVFATLHTNNAIQAVIRLVEIGIEPHMVAPSINCVLAQRLCGRLDEQYKEAYTPRREIIERFLHDVAEDEEPTFFRPGAAPHGKGYKGRVAIHELAIVSDEMRSLISQRAGTRELSEAARKLGYKPLRYDGMKKALLGLTTIEEVERSTPVEWIG